MTRLIAIVVLLFVCAGAAQAASTSTSQLKQKEHVSSSVVSWYEHTSMGRFVRRPGFVKCSEIRSAQAAGRCYRHRLNYRWHKARLRRIYPILHPKPVVPVVVAPSYLRSAFLCIHHYEGPWNANTGNGYYGGLQMDLAFQGLYGGDYLARWGTADNWPVWAQINAAVRAYQSGRGFWPWPNTARACGLL